MFHGNLNKTIAQQSIDVVSYDNAEWEYVHDLNQLRGFHVIRDPRDLCISAYFSHRYSHPTTGWPALEMHREKLQTLPKEDGMLLDMAFTENVLRALKLWNYNDPRILEVRLEDIIQYPYRTFASMFEFIHLLGNEEMSGTITLSELNAIVLQNEFIKKSNGRKVGTIENTHHLRKGIPGDWRNHFTPNIRSFFKEHYGEMLIQLGYEKDMSW